MLGWCEVKHKKHLKTPPVHTNDDMSLLLLLYVCNKQNTQNVTYPKKIYYRGQSSCKSIEILFPKIVTFTNKQFQINVLEAVSTVIHSFGHQECIEYLLCVVLWRGLEIQQGKRLTWSSLSCSFQQSRKESIK